MAGGVHGANANQHDLPIGSLRHARSRLESVSTTLLGEVSVSNFDFVRWIGLFKLHIRSRLRFSCSANSSISYGVMCCAVSIQLREKKLFVYTD